MEYMTFRMRGSLVKLIRYLALDAMKNKLSKLHWPLNFSTFKLEDINVFGESIIVEDSHNKYSWVEKSMYDMAPGGKI